MVKKSVQRIIIAEDSKTQAHMLSHLLETNGFLTEVACNGREALNMVRATPPDLLITDVIMPELDGYGLCKEIKSEKNLAELPVLLLTSLGKAEDILLGLECGADKYLMKPYDENLLIKKVKSLLEEERKMPGQNPETTHQIKYGGSTFQLNTSRRKILDMMLTIYEAAVQKNHKLQETQNNLSKLKGSLEKTVENKTADLQEKINKRRHIDSEIKRTEQKFRNLVDDALLGVFLSDLEGKLSYTNNSLVSLLDYSSDEELMEVNLEKLFYHQTDIRDIQTRIETERKIINLEVRLVSKNKEIKWALLNLTRTDNNLTGVILDITEKKKIKEKEEQFQEELKLSKEKAEESDHGKSIFLSNISSEIKNPINVISGFSSMLHNETLSPEQQAEYMAYIKKGTKELSVQIKNMLELARFEDAQLNLEDSDCLLNKMLDSIYNDWSDSLRLVRDSMVELRLKKGREDKTFTILTDQARLNNILTNLLSNAIKFTESGSIDIGYEIRGKELLFFVCYSGEGIAKEDQELIFERFKKADTRSLPKGKGAGLGLTISKALVQSMNGKIWLESEPGKGASFFFTIPLKTSNKMTQK
jgi:PAS domain S-box-containing protein